MMNLAAAGNYIKYGAYGFDYVFTQIDKTRNSFSVGYTDYVKDKDYKGLTFNAISYNSGMLSTDKINLRTEAGGMRIFAGKPGSVMILEYFKKEKKLDMRLEKDQLRVYIDKKRALQANHAEGLFLSVCMVIITDTCYLRSASLQSFFLLPCCRKDQPW